MPEYEPSSSGFLARLQFSLESPVDLRSTDTPSTLEKVRLLTAAAVYFNILAITDFGGRIDPEREHGLVEQVIGAAFQTFGEEDPHPGPFDKAAMILRGITQGHPFNDGNKRTSFWTAAYYLSRMDIAMPEQLPVDAAEQLSLQVSSGQKRDVAVIAQELKRLWGRND